MNRFSLIGFDFGSPWLLVGLVGAAIPVILHLLHRRNFRETSWAAMRFLAEAARKHSRRLRWEQLLLLLVRSLAVACLALALSRPFFDSVPASESNYEPRHLILVIDDSFSMGYRLGDRTRLDEAKQVARRLVESSRVGDGFSLLSMSGENRNATIVTPSYNRETVLAQLAAFALTEQTLTVGALPASLKNVLGTAPELKRKEVVMLSDFQTRDWPTGETARVAELRKLWSSSLQGAELSLFNLGTAVSPNAAVTSIRVASQPAFLGQTVAIEVVVNAWGGESLSGKLVELIADGKSIASRPIETTQAAEATVLFEFLPDSIGEHRIEARLQSDQLPIDDVGFAVVKVSREVRVLLVEGRFSSPPRERSTHYLSNALLALNDERLDRSRIVVSVASPLEFDEAALSQYDVIALCNLPTLSPEQVGRLSAYRGHGGQLLLVLGDLVRREDWNQILESGRLIETPVRLGTLASPTPEQTTVVGFLPDQLEHPIVRPFRGNPGTGLETAVIWNYFQLTGPELDDQQVVLRFENNDPAMIELGDESSRCLLVTTSMDALWGSWGPLSGSFQPIAEESLFYLLKGSEREARHLVGEPLSGSLDPAALAATIRLRTPSDEEIELRATRNGNTVEWLYDDVDRSGFYRLDAGAPVDLSRLIPVSLSAAESDLTSVSEELLKQHLLTTQRGNITAGGTGIPDSLQRDRSPLVAVLLWIALALLTIEILLARSYLLGLYSLVGAIVIAISLMLANLYEPQIGISSGMLLFALLLVYAVRKAVQPKPGTLKRKLIG